MASPFNVFRKHQKVILVAAGVLCMFVFVIGDALTPSGPSGGSGDREEVAVTWDGGELTRGQLYVVVSRRDILREFLLQAERMGMPDSPDGAQRSMARPVMELNRNRIGNHQDLAVRRLILAQKAREAGMAVSDAAINQYLRELTQNNVSSQQLSSLVEGKQAPSGRRVTIPYLFDALREEMLAQMYMDTYTQAVRTVTPQQRWDDWLKRNDQVVVESIAVPVGNFVDKVDEPTDQQVRDFYEKYKNQYSGLVRVFPSTELPSPEPGFRVPRKVKVHYIEAKHEALIKELANEVTDDEVREFYEENKDFRFVKGSSDIFDDDAAQQDPAENSDNSGNSATTNDGATDAPVISTDGGDGSELEGAPPKPAGDEARSGQGAIHLDLNASTRQVIFQTDSPPTQQEDATAEQSSLDQQADTEAENPTGEPTDPPLSNGSDATTTDQADDTLAGLDGAPPTPPGPPLNQPEIEYYPLEEVEQEIRETIADERVPVQLRERIPAVYGEIDRAFRKYQADVLDAQAEEKDISKVPRPNYDLPALAEKHGLTAGQTSLLSQSELRETPVGESLVSMQQQLTGTPYFIQAFTSEDLYEPVQTMRFVSAFQQALGRQDEYVIVKVEDKPTHLPKLEDIRADVVLAFKQIKARELAMDVAKTLAKDADANGGPLHQVLPAGDTSYAVIESDPFSWFEAPSATPNAMEHLGEPVGIDYAGPELLEKTFSMQPNDVAALFNHNKSTAYVVRLLRHERSREGLEQDFLTTASFSGDLGNMTRRMQQEVLAYTILNDVMKSANVTWNITPGSEQ